MWKEALNNRLFFNKYKIKKLIYESSYSIIYEGINVKDNDPVAIKLEKKTGEVNLLESEAYFLFYLKGYGIPKIITYGKSGLFNVLVEELLGLSLHSLWKLKKRYKNDSKLLIKDVCMIALQGLERLEYIHSKNIIHRDIKPLNFLIGKNNPEVIYLIDFGFARKYRSSRTGKHIKFKFIKYAYGSWRYYSINANRGYELSRRDDLESFGYMLVYLSKLYLPWISTENLSIDKDTKLKTIYKLKNSSTPENLCKDLPEGFVEFVRYTRNLEFEEDPNYDYLKSLFTNILLKNQQKNDLTFFWIEKKEKEGKERKNEEKKNMGKKRNSKNRLYKQIKLSLEKANNQIINSELRMKNKKDNSVDIIPNSWMAKNNLNNDLSKIKYKDCLNYKTSKNFDINNTKEDINNFYENEILRNKYEVYLKSNFNENDNYNDVQNRIRLFNKNILINPVEEKQLDEKFNHKI